MRISISIPEANTITNHGYGVASYGIVTSLQRLGHEVPFQDPTAPVEFNFSQPYLWKWSNPNSYKIGMAAWESTKIPNSWKSGLATCDELWTPSPVIAQWYENEGYPVSQVYEHGIDSTVWTRKRRRPTGPVRFLHFGEPAPRKGGQMVYEAFRELFGNSSDASLTIKAHGSSTIRGKGNSHPDKELNNVKIIKHEMPEWELVDLVKRHDVLVYPSYGEGFGLIPLQALSTGMPVISISAWAPYRNLLLPELRVKSHLGESPWPSMHPGNVFHPEPEDLKRAMCAAFDNYSTISARAYANAMKVEEKYNWDKLTSEAFEHIAQKFDDQQ
jgi:glycosyltransferase involved in cell wall biosynthesis